MSNILSQEEFTKELIGKSNDIYKAYLTAVSNQSIPDQLLGVLDNLPEFKASDPSMTEEEKSKAITDFNNAQKNEEIAFTIGKVLFSIAVKCFLA